jgi:uncharacterized protein YraI
MAEKPKPRTVFISSTLRDLREYRSAVTRALQKFDLEVLRNDVMDASPDEPVEAMLKLIDECEVFIGIYARYYGRIPEGYEVSYIETEYEYAKKIGKPQLCFILDQKQTNWPQEWTESDPSARQQLYRFLDKVTKGRIVGFFMGSEDLIAEVDAAMKKYLNDLSRNSQRKEKSEPAPIRYQITTETLNVREGPSPNSPVVGILKKGDVVDGTEVNADGGWILISSGQLKGWCSREFLSEEKPAPGSIPYQVTVEALNVRNGPGPSYPVVGTLKKGDIVDGSTVSADGSWILISSGQLKGWCSSEFVSKIDNPPASSAPVPGGPGDKVDNPPASSPPVPGGLGYKEKDRNPKTDSDRPSGMDRLKYSRYAESFAKIILNHETSTPLTIGIYGQWGQGKSFLMGKIKDALNAKRVERWEKAHPFSAAWQKKNPQERRTMLVSGALFNQVAMRISAALEKSTNWIADLFSQIYTPGVLYNNYKQWLETRKNNKAETVEFSIVEFNAWAYVGTDHLWAGLVTHLYRDVEKYFGLRLVFARLWRAIKRSLPKSLLIVGFYALLGLGISFIVNFEDIVTSWSKLAVSVTQALGASAIGGLGLAGLPTLWNTLKDFADNLFLARSKNLQNLAAKPDFRAQIGVMADIKEEIRFIGDLLRKGKNGHPTRFVLFIDDLDRCEHHKAIEVLQAIMLLLADEDGAPFVIFLGLDARVLVKAIEATYEEVLVKAGINGYEYLDKIVQVPFVIPPASKDDIKNYVDSMLWSSEKEKEIISKKLAEKQQREKAANGKPITPPTPSDDNKQKAGDGKQPIQETPPPEPTIPEPLEEIPAMFTEAEREALKGYALDLTDNPRKIKRIINIYRFTRLLLPSADLREKAIRWILMTEQWPFHVAWILELIENDVQTKKDELKEKNIQDVFALVEENIYAEEMVNLLGIDADPDLFKQFIAKSPVFTVQDVKDLLPYTYNLNPAIHAEVSKQALWLAEKKATSRAAGTGSGSGAQAAA